MKPLQSADGFAFASTMTTVIKTNSATTTTTAAAALQDQKMNNTDSFTASSSPGFSAVGEWDSVAGGAVGAGVAAGREEGGEEERGRTGIFPHHFSLITQCPSIPWFPIYPFSFAVPTRCNDNVTTR